MTGALWPVNLRPSAPRVSSPLEVAWIPSLLAAMACRVEGRSLARGMLGRMRLTLVPESAMAVGRWVEWWKGAQVRGDDRVDVDGDVDALLDSSKASH